MKSKKPDNVVFDEDQERYDASVKPYGTDLAAPAIHFEDLGPWKRRGVSKVNATFSAEFQQLSEQYEELKARAEYNELVYASRFSFEPVVGNTYYLYRDKAGASFLSILSPEECNFDHLGSFRLEPNLEWIKV